MISRILFMAPQPFFQARGTPINVRNVLGVLGGAGFRADLLTYHAGGDVPLKNVEIKRIPRFIPVRSVPIGPSAVKIPLDIIMLFKAFSLMLKNRYHCVHAVEESVFMALLLKKIFKVPYIYDMDSSLSGQLRDSGKAPFEFILRLVERLERAAVENSLAVLTVCGALTETVRRMSPAKKIFQAEDCPAIPACRTAAPRRLPPGFSGKDGALVIMYTGNLEAYQGAEMLVRSFARVLRSVPRARLVIAGGEPRQVDELRRLARQAGAELSVCFTGKVPVEEVPSLLELADILVSPRLDGVNTPLKIYDYLASGKPVVATDLPTHTQVLNGKIAVLAAPRPESLAEGILGLAEDPALRRRLGRRGKKFVEENYGFGVFRKKILALYAFAEENIGKGGGLK